MNLINSKQKVWLLVKCCVMVITVLVLLFLKHNPWVIDSHFSKFNPNLKNYLKTNDSFELRDNTNSLVDSTSNNSIEIGGIRYANESCLTTHLQVLPSYTGEACSQHPSACQSLTCLDILTSKKKKQWKNLVIKPEDVAYDDILYHDLSCPHFKKSRGFVLEPLSQESANFSIAFNILIHKSARQFEILLRSIYRPQNSFCIHVDGKASKNLTKAIENIISCFPNVFLASKMEKVIYAGYSRLQADITCMDDHLKRSSPFKYLINTAAQAFPIKTNEEMVKILKIYNGSNDIEGIYGKRLLKARYMLYWTENLNKSRIDKIHKKVQPLPPHNIDIVRGSAYGIFSRGFVEFIVNDQRAVDLLKWSRHTYSPDEFYWATLHHTYSNPHLHTPGGFPGYPSDKKWLAVYANWGDGQCSGKFVRGVCVNGAADLDHLIRRKEFFVNKFYLEYQPLALSCLASWVAFKESCTVDFDDSYYRTLKFIRK